MSKRTAVETLPDMPEAVEQAKADAKQVKSLTFEQVLAAAKIEAIKEIPGDITFHIGDKEAKDPKTGKALQSTFTLPNQTARELFEVQSVAGAVVNRWMDLEPKLTEPRGKNGELSSIFAAPECFENITSDMHHGLRRALQRTNAHFMHAVDVIQKMGKNTATQTAGERAQFIAAKQQKVDAERAITRAIDTMHQHWKNRQTPTTEAGSVRKAKGVKLILDVVVNTLTRRMQSKKVSEAEKTLAAQARMVLLWIRMDPKAAEVAFLAWEKARTAKSQQDVKAAHEVSQVNQEAKAALDAASLTA